MACGDGGIGFQDLTWTTWTAHNATGSGHLFQNDCTPNCAHGTFYHYEASLTVTTVVASISGPVFSVVNASYPNGGPNGKASATFTLPTPPPPTPTCSANQLHGSVTSPAVSGQFSEQYVDFTNVSSQACHMVGFPGFELVDSAGTSILNAARGCPWAGAGSCPTAVAYLNLPAHSGTAFFGFAWQSTPQPGQTCPASTAALVTPPNAFGHLTLPVHIAVCGEPPRLGVGTVQYAI